LAKPDRLLEAIPDVAINLFDGGHSAFLEQPDAFAEGFRAFTARLVPQTAAAPAASRD
jgi:hypothetical protein